MAPLALALVAAAAAVGAALAQDAGAPLARRAGDEGVLVGEPLQTEPVDRYAAPEGRLSERGAPSGIDPDQLPMIESRRVVGGLANGAQAVEECALVHVERADLEQARSSGGGLDVRAGPVRALAPGEGQGGRSDGRIVFEEGGRPFALDADALGTQPAVFDQQIVQTLSDGSGIARVCGVRAVSAEETAGLAEAGDGRGARTRHGGLSS